MPDAAWIALALVATALGLAWLALAMDAHWEQAHGARQAPRGAARGLRVAGSLALAAGFACLLQAGHASMAVLVWTMALALGAVLVAAVLAWRPRLLAPLTAPFLAFGGRRAPRGRSGGARA